MLEKAFELAVVFSAVDGFSGPVQKMASSLGILDERTKAVQQRMNEFKNMAFVGGAITMAGGGLAKVMDNGLNQAGQFLSTMTMIKDTTGATADQMDRIQNTIRNSSGKTIFGIQDTANYAKLLATSGMNDNQINSLLPLFTQYAEVQKLGKGSDPNESIKQAIGAAHTIGAYDPKSLAAFLDKYNKATFMQPGSTSEYADTFKYVSSRTAGLNMSSNDMLMLSALSNRVGLVGSMGGTEAADMILRSIPGLMGGSTKKDSKQTAALKELGINPFNKNGQFEGVGTFISQLSTAGKKFNPEQLAKLFHDAFGQQGMGLATILASPRGKDQLDALQQQMGNMKSIGQMQEDTNNTPEGQILQLQTNLSNLKLDVWLQLAKTLNPIFHYLNDIVTKVQAFSKTHPQIAKLAADFMLFSTAAALVIGPLLLLVGTLGYLHEASMIGTGFTLLGGAFSSAIGPIMLLISAGYLLYQAWQTDFGGIREKSVEAFDWIKKEIPVAEKELTSLAKALGLETAKGFQIPEWLKVLMGMFVGGKAVNFLGGGLLNIGGSITKAFAPLRLGLEMFKSLGVGKAGAFSEMFKSIDFGKLFLSGGKGLGNIGESLLRKLFGNNTIDIAKFIGGKGLDLGKFLGSKGIDLGKLLGKNSVKLISDITKAVMDFGPKALDGVKAAGKFGLTLLQTGAQALMAAGRMAAAWVIGLGPIGWVIIGVIAVLALLWAAWRNNWGNIREHFAQTVTWIETKWNIIKDFFKNLPSEAETWGKNLIDGFVNGIENNVEWLKNKVSGTFNNNVVAPIKNLLGIHSPSVLMHSFGQYTVEGFANGMNNNLGKVKDASSKLTDLARPGDTSGTFDSNGAGNGIYIAEGAIVINAAPGQSAEEIANAVMEKISRKMRNQSYARSTGYVPQW